ncbi:MAG: hypothetical protein MUC92_10925, partial [Fimbriimonadaceae bacterium]|nr:hypothetical protein [Fimbriimonadaceae bacterium]
MFLLHAELGPGKREETFQDLVQSLGGVSVQHEELIKALLPGAGAVLEAGFYLQSRQELRRLVLADCSKSTISARLQMMGHVAKAVKYSFPVLVGELLVQEVGHRPKLRTVGLGLQRFEDLLPAEPLAVLVPQNVISPGTERLGLSLVDNNLPGTWDSFVGREKELRDCQLLTGRSQLITIKGCGGVGKTRFVQHLAALMRHQGIEVIRYVRFSDLPPGSPVLHRFLDTCQLSGSSLESFIDRYREKRTLVVLDNCEHVLPEARGLVKGLLHDFPLLTLICTTREPFEVPGEVVYELGGLETPSEEVQLSESGAIQLFVDRYREQRPLEIL